MEVPEDLKARSFKISECTSFYCRTHKTHEIGVCYKVKVRAVFLPDTQTCLDKDCQDLADTYNIGQHNFYQHGILI